MQTLRELLAEAERESKAHSDTWPGESRWRTAYEVLGMLKLLDLTIVEGVGFVAMDVVAAQHVLIHCMCPYRRENGVCKDSCITSGLGAWVSARKDVRAILTACGIIVPDDVVEVLDSTSVFNRGGMFIASGPGDTITITRKEGE